MATSKKLVVVDTVTRHIKSFAELLVTVTQVKKNQPKCFSKHLARNGNTENNKGARLLVKSISIDYNL